MTGSKCHASACDAADEHAAAISEKFGADAAGLQAGTIVEHGIWAGSTAEQWQSNDGTREANPSDGLCTSILAYRYPGIACVFIFDACNYFGGQCRHDSALFAA